MQINNKIRTSPTGLLIHLAKAAQTEDLSLPDDSKTLKQKHNPFAKPDPKHPNIQYGYAQTPQYTQYNNNVYNSQTPSDNPRPINAEQKQKAAVKAERKAQRLAKKKQRHEALLKANEALNNLRMLQEHCQMVDSSLEEQAKRYGMEDILAQFPQEVAAFKARE